MRILVLILFIFINGCTYIHYNADTKDFVYMSSKECEHCEAFYNKGEVKIKIGKLKAFEGQKGLFDSLVGNLDTMGLLVIP